MFRSAIWQAILEAEREAAGAMVIEDDAMPETRAALLARATAASERLRRCLLPPLVAPLPPVVALLLPRCADYVAAALAALAAGCAFLPLEQGEDAAAHACARRAGARMIVVPDGSPLLLLPSRAPGEKSSTSTERDPPPPNPPPLCVMSVGELFGRTSGGGGSGGPCLPPGAPSSPSSTPTKLGASSSLLLPYYCLLPTSGSTSPASKMVRLTEEGLLRRCRWALHDKKEDEDEDDHHPKSPPPYVRGDAVAFTTSPAFVDHLAQQVFAPLLFAGGGRSSSQGAPPLRLVVVREENEEQQHEARPSRPLPLLARPRALVEALGRCCATHFVTVPSVLAGIVACGLSLPATLRCVISSGEPLAVGLAEALLLPLPLLLSSSQAQAQARNGNAAQPRLLNLYGSTETSGDCAWLDVGWWLRGRCRLSAGCATPAAAIVPAGVPLDEGVSLRLRHVDGDGGKDEDEVLVGGWCVAGGYHGRGEEDDDAAAAFWTETTQEGEEGRRRWFATGDGGRWVAFGGGGGGGDEQTRAPAPLRLLHVDGRLSSSSSSSFAKVAGGARVDCAVVEAALLRAGVGPVAVRAWWPPASSSLTREAGDLAGGAGGGGGNSAFLAAYVEDTKEEEGAEEEAVQRGLHRPRLLAPGDPLRRALERASDAAGLPARMRPAVYLALAGPLPRCANGSGKLLRSALPEPPQPQPQPLSEGAVLAALRAALEAVGGDDGDEEEEGDGPRPPPLEPAEDALSRAGGGAASRVAVAAAAALGIPPPLVFAFPSARQLARALAQGKQQDQQQQQQQQQQQPRKRAREGEEEEEGGEDKDDDDGRPWPAAEEAWSVPLHLCVDADPVVVAGASIAAAASHGGEVACWPLAPRGPGGGAVAQAEEVATVARLRLPGSLDAGIAALRPGGLFAVVCRTSGSTTTTTTTTTTTLHLLRMAASVLSPEAPPLALPAVHVSTPPAVCSLLAGDGRGSPGSRRHLLFLATHAPNPRLLVVRVDEPRSGAASWRLLAATAPLSAPSAATPLVLGVTSGEAPGGCGAIVVVATLDGGLAAFRYAPNARTALRQVWRSSSSSSFSPPTPAPIFGAPVVLNWTPGRLVAAAHVDGRVRAVASGDGACAWEASVGGSSAGASLCFARLAVVERWRRDAVPAPVVVVAATEDGVLHGLDGASGLRLWTLALRRRGARGGGGAAGADVGVCSPLAVPLPGDRAGLVVVAHDGRVFGLRCFGDDGDDGGAGGFVNQCRPTVVSEQRVGAATYGAPVLVSAVLEQEQKEEGGSSFVAVVAIGCRDDRVRAVRVRL